MLSVDELKALTPRQLAYLDWQSRWIEQARVAQLPPEPAEQERWLQQVNLVQSKDGTPVDGAGETWSEMGIMAGRGFGKTRVGAEWLGRVAHDGPDGQFYSVVAPTQSDVRFTCFEGESGLLNVIPRELVQDYNRTDLILTMHNGATIRGFSAEKADRLRGPQSAASWCTPGDTLVRMADGTDRRVDSIRAGEMVLTRRGPRRVVLSGRSGNPNPQVRISCGVSDLTVTVDHPVLTNRGWLPAGEVREGDQLCVLAAWSGAGSAGTPAAEPALLWLEVTAAERLQTRVPVYCLKVEGQPEYFANGILVHNCDELAAWGKDAQYTWDMLMFGLRLGDHPRVLWTTTPKPVPLVRDLIRPQPGRIVVAGATFDNRSNLPKSFFRKLEVYEGTRLGRQELYGEMIDPEEAGIVRRSWINLWPANRPLPKLEYIVMSLDTAFTEKTLDSKTGDPDPTACGVWGLFFVKSVAHVILLDCWEEHLSFPDLLKKTKRELNTPYGDDEDVAMIRPLFGSAKPVTSGRKPDMLLIEDKGSGISLRQTLQQAGIEAYAYNPGRADKLSRLHIVSPIFAQRRVWVPESMKHPGKPRTWAEPLISQLCSFAGEGSIKHDDHVDQTTQAFRVMMDQGLLAMVRPTHEQKRLAEAAAAKAAEPVANPYAT